MDEPDLLSGLVDKSLDTFTAQFDDDCNRCGRYIFEGDEAGYVDDELVCERCWENA